MPQLTRPAKRPRESGFTLVELAVTLLVVTILAGMLLIPLTGREAIRARQATERQLEAIREALIGYAVIHGKLPCPTRQADPTATDYGLTDDANCTLGSEGYLPWRTLGLPQVDAWGVSRLSASDPWLGYWRYRVAPALAGTNTIKADALPDVALDVKDVVTGQAMVGDKTLAALVYSTGPDRIANGDNASYESGNNATYAMGGPTTSFDDLLIWISRPQLIARLAAAGSL